MDRVNISFFRKKLGEETAKWLSEAIDVVKLVQGLVKLLETFPFGRKRQSHLDHLDVQCT